MGTNAPSGGLFVQSRRNLTATAAILIAGLRGPTVAGESPAGASPTPAEEIAGRVARLVRALSHPEFAERERATEALIEIGAPALPEIRPLLESADGETAYRARRICYAVRGFGPEVEDRILSAQERLSRGESLGSEEAAAIVEAGPAAVAFALGILEKTAGEGVPSFRDELVVRRRLRSFEMGGWRGGSEDLSRLGPKGIELLGRAARSQEEPTATRVFALNSLRQVSKDAAKAAALDLLEDRNAAVRQAAIVHLLELAQPGDFPDVARREGTIPGRSVLEGRKITESLARRMDPGALREHLRSDDERVRAAAAWALGLRREKGARDELKRSLEDQSAAVRAEAARALGAIKEAEDLEPLGAHFGAEGNPEAREACLEGLAGFGDQAVGWVSLALRDPDATVRRRAATLLGRAGTTKAIPALIATLDDPDAGVVAAVLESIGALGKTDLPRLAGTGTPESRKKAIEDAKSWWNRKRAELSAKDKTLGETAVEGGRMLGEIERIIREHFVSVRPQEKEKPGREPGKSSEDDVPAEARPESLKKAAVQVVQRALESEKSPLAGAIRGPLRALLARGSFRSAADAAEFLGALPIGWERKDYVDLVQRMAKGIVESLEDPFSRLIVSHDPEGRFSQEIIPLLFGPEKTNGLLVKKSGDDLLVDFVLAGSPAERAGLRHGDQLILIDGKPATKFDRDDLAQALNRKVTLAIFRQGWTRSLPFELEPEAVFEKEPVRFAVLPGKIGYLWLQYFGLGTDAKVEWALRELEREGIRGLVFDLRNNPGGLLVACTNIADKFLRDKVKITTLEPRKGADSKQEIYASASPTDREYPLAILLCRSSASASELFSGSLKDNGRAVIVGERSYGKGIGQAAFPVSGFSGKSLFGDSATFSILSLTMLRYYFPSGGNPHGVGVSPDKEVQPWTATGERSERFHSLLSSKALADYVEKIAGDSVAAALARWDGKDPSRYPGFDDFYSRLTNPPSREDVRIAVRRALRARLAASDPDGGWDLADPVDDRVLWAGIEAVAEKLSIQDIGAVMAQEFESAGAEASAAPEPQPPAPQPPPAAQGN